jgi:Flp pilus assembly protein TadG
MNVLRVLSTSEHPFPSDDRGNVGMMFAIILPLLLTGGGAAVDYTRAASARAAMQSAADAAALMISKEAGNNLSAAEVTTKAQAYFNALFNRTDIGSVTFSATYSANSGNGASVQVTAAGTMKTDFMKMAGIPTVPINVASTTRWGNMRYRVALALDNTGSMSSANKMDELKKATKELINDFYAMAKAKDDIYISIVPFSRDVNVGKDKKDASWLRWDEWEETNGKCKHAGSYKTRTECVAAAKSWETDDHDKWDGCVMDRDQNYDVSGTNPSNSIYASMAPVDDYKDCPEPVLKMTSVRNDKSDLIDRVEDMKPKGNTNQAIGLAWAWLTHSSTGPFAAPAKDANYTYLDAIIILTDGANTQNRWHKTAADIDARQSLLCTNVKADGMKVFAVQVATDGDAESTMLKNCTSEPSNPNYFSKITQASQMSVKFENIFKELSKLRVSS